MGDMGDGVNLRELLDAIDRHPGKQARAAWDGLRRVHVVLLRNQTELVSVISALEENRNGLGIEVIQNVRPSPVREAFYDELIQRLHNYVASVATLVDHTRNLMKRYEGTPSGDEYQRRIAAVTAAPITPLIQKLRNYFLHYRIPPLGVQMTFDQGARTEKFACFFSRTTALEWPDWPVLARRYLEQHKDDHISLASLIAEYAAGIDALYSWLYAQFEVLHWADIRDVNALIAQTPGARRADGTAL